MNQIPSRLSFGDLSQREKSTHEIAFKALATALRNISDEGEDIQAWIEPLNRDPKMSQIRYMNSAMLAGAIYYYMKHNANNDNMGTSALTTVLIPASGIGNRLADKVYNKITGLDQFTKQGGTKPNKEVFMTDLLRYVTFYHLYIETYNGNLKGDGYTASWIV